MLRGKKIILGITGSIAAYKAAILVRGLVKQGAEVQVVMTESAKDFVTPLTLSTLSNRPALSSFMSNRETGLWNNHVDLGLWADLILIAPASANTLGKMAQGMCDNLLTAVILSARCPVWVAPAMDLDMFAHESTQANLKILESRDVHVIEPESGFLASGLEGKGRMAEPENIIAELQQHFPKGSLYGKQVLITAGPTYEPIDPVRFIGNRSSGKMGIAIANEAARRGAEVTLVLGPTHIADIDQSISVKAVESAQEMYEAAVAESDHSDIIICSAAVSDYTPSEALNDKQKKSDSDWRIELKPTKDILAHLGQNKSTGQLVIGFALETSNEIENARGKLARKNADMIVLNSLQDKGAGFGHDTNKATFVLPNNKLENLELMSKLDLASRIIDKIESL